MSTSVSYAGNDIQTAFFVTTDIQHNSAPERDVRVYTVAHADESTIPHVSYPKKMITLRGTIVSSSIAGCDSLINTFKLYMDNKDANLDIGYNNGTIRYVCTPRNVKISRPGGLSYAFFEVDMIATEPFGKNTAAETVFNLSNQTTNPTTQNFNLSGVNAPKQYVIFTVTLDIINGTGDQSISISNDSTGETVTVTREWTATEVLKIDPELMKVTVDDVEVGFSGAIPTFGTGSSDVTYSDTFSGRTVDINAVYTKRYL